MSEKNHLKVNCKAMKKFVNTVSDRTIEYVLSENKETNEIGKLINNK